jgi:hypothetical protein
MEAVKGINSIINTLLNTKLQDADLNIRQFEEREQYITSLKAVEATLFEVLERVGTALSEVQERHNSDLDKISKLVHGSSIRNDQRAITDSSWTTIHKKKVKKLMDIASTSRVPTPLVPKQPHIEVTGKAARVYNRVPITRGLSIPAVVVPTIAQCEQDGNLYYIQKNELFAFRIAGQLFYGNIGNIYTDSKEPVKIKECKYSGKCMRMDTCNYYHDPKIFPESKDCRNYIASSFLYASPDAYRSQTRCRRFGSKENLEMDIVDLSQEERYRFCDQSMHDILCAMLIKITNQAN